LSTEDRRERAALLSSRDAADAVGVTQSTLREWAHRGLLTNYGTRRIALYDAAELVAAIEAKKPRRRSDTPPATRSA